MQESSGLSKGNCFYIHLVETSINREAGFGKVVMREREKTTYSQRFIAGQPTAFRPVGGAIDLVL